MRLWAGGWGGLGGGGVGWVWVFGYGCWEVGGWVRGGCWGGYRAGGGTSSIFLLQCDARAEPDEAALLAAIDPLHRARGARGFPLSQVRGSCCWWRRCWLCWR